MKAIEIFESVSCCSPVVDKANLRVSVIIDFLKEKGITVIRHNLTKEPEAFATNQVIHDFIAKKGIKALPITIMDNKIMKSGTYPSSDDFSAWTGISAREIDAEIAQGNSCDCGCGCN